MKKYLLLLSLSWQNGFVYRTSVVMWRLRQFLSSVMALTVWSVLFVNQTNSFGYTKSGMITYIFLTAILQTLILATVLHGLAESIYSGDISKELVKPINIIAYLGVQDIADKLKNFIFVVIESCLLFLLFRPSIELPAWPVLALLSLWIVMGVIIHFWITLLFGMLGFVTPDVWGPKFFYFMILQFTAGKLFPLDILPPLVQKVLHLTPFPLLSYVQIQLFLNKLSTPQIMQYSLELFGWTVGLGLFTMWCWRAGMKSYTASGQ